MFFENIKLALRSMRGNKLRTLLSLLGIIIGVASVVTILNLGNSATDSITGSITSSGYNIIYVYPIPNQKTRDTFNELFAQDMKSNVEGIQSSMIQNSSSTRIRNKQTIKSATVLGVESSYAENMEYEVDSGAWFTAEDNIFKRQVVVLGAGIAEKLFPGGNAVGNYVSLYRTQSKKYLVVGVMKTKDSTLGGSFNDSIFIPYNTFQQRFMKTGNVGTYILKVADGHDPKIVSKSIESYLSGVVSSESYTVLSSASLAEMASTITGTLSTFLAAIGGISLLVGGIGIMNIMLVSVAERTKEIGIRKALGAAPKVIKSQFLTEAITLTSIGGLIGVMIGIGMSKLVTNIAGWAFSISWNAVVLSVVFSMVVGVFFGLYPAAKAAKLDPIESLNYE